MNDREKVLEGLKEMLEVSKYHDSVQWNTWADTGTLEAAIAMLKAQEARVMTLEEACGADECWLERKGKPVTVADLAFNGRTDGMDVDSRELNTLGEYVLSSVYYGEYWRCWTSRPTDAQREEAKW